MVSHGFLWFFMPLVVIEHFKNTGCKCCFAILFRVNLRDPEKKTWENLKIEVSLPAHLKILSAFAKLVVRGCKIYFSAHQFLFGEDDFDRNSWASLNFPEDIFSNYNMKISKLMWKASLYSPHLPLDLIEDMTPWTSWSCIGEHFSTSVSSLIFLARPMIPCKELCSETDWHYQICTQRINASGMQVAGLPPGSRKYYRVKNYPKIPIKCQ